MTGAAILAAHTATLALAAQQMAIARAAFCERLQQMVPLRIDSNRAVRNYEVEPSAAHHAAYCAAWQALHAALAETDRLQALRAQAIAAHSTAWTVVDAIQRLRAAGVAVAALGYDPNDLLV